MFHATKQRDGLATCGTRELRPHDPYLKMKQSSCIYGGSSACKLRINDLESNYVQFKKETNGLAMQEHTIHDILRAQPMYGKTATFVQQYQENSISGNETLLRAKPMQYISPTLGIVYRNEHSAKAASMSAMLDQS